ncbi:hypothetical protein COEREDRAFT_39948 [Coemansia reversa NRRL 1564]|uniref:non-specific serine/threonine protein kinase n=1 Tax=Coemansia reversa (strain ATCC 12441 / NRRL 1564) TaxID=763665 RepID=A0A2G5BGK4_COERN|nr:hypothetical protein COEREDRAFT_39948 [Coemansia reversa NRRL 1564]|eukprot:PIA17837.1 hypothetical protein COEREDRAFT_39948 [Coemansia reversa NRRL 1564]
MRVHRGVIDPDALSELPPDVLFSRVLQTLDDLGFTVLKTEDLKIRVLRPRREDIPTSNRIRTMSTNKQTIPPPYGPPQVDNGDEVQLVIEVCKIKNLNNFFIVHLSRRKGNAWTYKHLYHLIIETLALRSDDVHRYAPKAQ